MRPVQGGHSSAPKSVAPASPPLLKLFPDFDPVLIHLGPLAIRWYALAYVAGILLGWRYIVYLTKTPRLWQGSAPSATPMQIDDLVLWATLGVILGGRIGYILFYDFKEMMADPLEMLKVWHGGMSFHGGFLGVALAIIVFSRVNKLNMLRLADVVAPCAQ